MHFEFVLRKIWMLIRFSSHSIVPRSQLSRMFVVVSTSRPATLSTALLSTATTPAVSSRVTLTPAQKNPQTQPRRQPASAAAAAAATLAAALARKVVLQVVLRPTSPSWSASVPWPLLQPTSSRRAIPLPAL
jgi:hypothetical protein